MEAKEGMTDTNDTHIHTYLNCRQCIVLGGRAQVEAGISRTGIVIKCKKHGLIGHFDPDCWWSE